VRLPSVQKDGQALKTDHVWTTYIGVEERWARALTEALETARSIYMEDFGFDMPDTVRLEIRVFGDFATQLYTNGVDGVFLNLHSPEDIAKPEISHYHNLYGMCHELAGVSHDAKVKAGYPLQDE
jgi:hypothetical protein